MTAVGQLMDERRVAVEGEDDRLILGEQHVVLGVGQAVRMLPLGLQLHQVNHVDNANLEFGQLFPQMDTAASVSSVGVSPQHAITTSGSAP